MNRLVIILFIAILLVVLLTPAVSRMLENAEIADDLGEMPGEDQP